MKKIFNHQKIGFVFALLTLIFASWGVLWVLWDAGIIFLRYFTIQSNILVILVSLLYLFQIDFKGSKYLYQASLLSIVVTSIVFHTMLTGYGLTLKNHLTHSFAPIMYCLFYFLFVQKSISLKMVWTMLIHPLVYFIFFMIYGVFTQFYPYPFMDVILIGWSNVLRISLLILFPAMMVGSVLLTILKIAIEKWRLKIT